VNETGTRVSERVHLCEIVVIPGIDCLTRAIEAISADRLPFADSADISAAIPLSALQGRNHGD
jgi:hypothetical protein